MDLGKKLLELTDGIAFQNDEGVDTPGKFKSMADYNYSQCLKIRAMDEERVIRIQEVMCAILGDALQKSTISEYGSTDEDAMRAVLARRFAEPEIQQYLHKMLPIWKQAMEDEGIPPSVIRKLSQLIDCLPQMLTELILEAVRRWRLLPRSQAPEITRVLAEMLKEGDHGHGN